MKYQARGKICCCELAIVHLVSLIQQCQHFHLAGSASMESGQNVWQLGERKRYRWFTFVCYIFLRHCCLKAASFNYWRVCRFSQTGLQRVVVVVHVSQSVAQVLHSCRFIAAECAEKQSFSFMCVSMKNVSSFMMNLLPVGSANSLKSYELSFLCWTTVVRCSWPSTSFQWLLSYLVSVFATISDVQNENCCVRW